MQSHGSIVTHWHNSQLEIKVNGPFNELGITNCFEQLKNEIVNRPQHALVWTRIDLLDNDSFGSPDVMKVIYLSYLFSFEHQCQAIASVVGNNIQKSMINALADKLPNPIAAFNDKASANSWLQKYSTK